ncbi:hypothetical protein YC2023_008377 [Brassica napus]
MKVFRCIYAKINEERASMVAQFAKESTLRKILAAEKYDDEMPPIEAIFAPLEYELKLPRKEAFYMAFIRLIDCSLP